MSRSLRKNWRICRNRKPTQELGARQGQEGSSGGAEERTSLSWKTSTASGATSATFPGLYRREGDGDICAHGTFAPFLPQLGLSPKDGSVPFLFMERHILAMGNNILFVCRMQVFCPAAPIASKNGDQKMWPKYINWKILSKCCCCKLVKEYTFQQLCKKGEIFLCNNNNCFPNWQLLARRITP